MLLFLVETLWTDLLNVNHLNCCCVSYSRKFAAGCIGRNALETARCCASEGCIIITHRYLNSLISCVSFSLFKLYFLYLLTFKIRVKAGVFTRRFDFYHPLSINYLVYSIYFSSFFIFLYNYYIIQKYHIK